MRNALLAAGVLVAMLFAAAAVCAQQPVSSKITEVTVFFDRARVSRQAATSVDSGTHRLLIPLEAFSIAEKSVTADVMGEGEVLGVQVAKVPVIESPRRKIREIEDRLKDLRDRRQAVRDEKTALGQQEAFLKGVVDFAGTQLPKEIQTRMPAPEDWDATLDFLGKRFPQIFEQKRASESRLAELEETIEQLKRELDMLRGRADRTATGIEVLFRSKKAQNLDITVRYMVRNAGWSPVYRAFARDAASGVDLSMMGQIRQKTGEDWENVNLSVSTVEPVLGGRLPEVPAWHLDTPKMRGREVSSDRVMRKEMMAIAPQAGSAAPMAEAQRRKTALSFEYTLPEPVTVAYRDEKTLLPLFTKAIDGEFYHYAAPGRDPRAYLVCRAKADSELLAGPVNIFFTGRYVGEMFLEEKQPGEDFLLALGADRAVSLKREKIRDHRKETAFFGQIERDSVVRDIKYRITAENLKDRKITLQVTDAVPVSKTDRIQVEDIAFSPDPQTRDVNGKPGVMRWRFGLEPGQNRSITISFTVSYPRDMPPPAF